jgi:hypothetical protein
MRLAVLFITSTVALLAATACASNDKKNTSTDAGNMCKGVYSDKTLEQLTTGAKSGACTSATDLAAVCANDINGTASNCGLSCNSQPGDAGTKVACTVDCVKGHLNPPPSDSCIGCYADSVACTFQFCLEPCLAGASDPACIACRVQHGCAGAFYNSCSGLPLPTGLDLGSAGAGGSSAGGGANGGSSGAAAGGASTAGSANGGAGG